MRDYFYDFADRVGALLKPGEVFTCHLVAEDSDFVRLNHNRVRQAGRVRQIEVGLELIQGTRHAAAQFTVSGEPRHDRGVVEEHVRALRAQLRDDPYMLYARQVHSSEDCRLGSLPEAGDAVAGIMNAAEGLDLVGYLASGAQYAGFASSLGSRTWFERVSFNFDWSCHLDGDKAVKSSYAGSEWNVRELRQRVDHARAQLDMLKRPPKTLTPGRYRAYLAPAALHEILDTVSYGGFGLKQHRTLQSPLLKLARQERLLAASVDMVEDNEHGLAPPFTPSGFIKPRSVNLIRQGRYQDSLAAPRSAREYGLPVNATFEVPESLHIAGGELAMTDALAALDTGLYINNLWYCNFSHRAECRLTGMTRYACFWVERGEIVAPVNVMRFDDSLYRMLGDHLIGLTREREFRLDASTYDRRSTKSMLLPGVLVGDFNLTL